MRIRLFQLTGGAYAEYVAVSEKVAAIQPHNMTHEEAGAVPLAGLTALQGLRDSGKIQKGQKVLINGASGGVGTYAVQIGKVMEAEVTGVCSSQNIELVQSLGANRVIDYKQQDFTQEGKQYDIIFDVVGNCSFPQCKDSLTSKGIYVTTQPLPKVLLKNLSSLLSRKQAKVILMQPNGEDLAYLTRLIQGGKLRSIIDRTYPLSEVAKAHAYSQEGHATGKIVIRC